MKLFAGLLVFVLGANSFTFAQGVTWISTTNSAPWVTQPAPNLVDDNPAQQGALSVDPAGKLQEIDGFGGCFNELGWVALGALSEKDRTAAIAALFDKKGCDFNICRMPIGASDFATKWYSMDETPDDYNLSHFTLDEDRKYLIPFIKAAMVDQPDLQVWGSAWSPPAWMKTNNKYAQGSLRWEPRVLTAYAKYLAMYVQEYRKAGIHVYAVHVQNEPMALPSFPSCTWNGDQMREFIGDYLGPEFKKQKLDAQIWLGTLNDGDVNAFARIVLGDPVAAAFVTGVGYQYAGSDAIGPTHLAWPKIRLMQTESECGDGSNNWAAAENTWSLIHHYLSNGANSYMYWNMVLDQTGNSTWGWRQNALVTVDTKARTVHYNPEFYLMQHFSHFVKAGAHRIAVSGGAGNAMAFLNADGSIVLELANLTDKDAPTSVRLGKQMWQATLPPRSFNTFVVPGKE